MQLSARKQLGTQTFASVGWQHRYAKLGATVSLGVLGVREVGNGDQAQAAVKDAIHLVTVKVQALRISFNLGVLRRITKAHVAVSGRKF